MKKIRINILNATIIALVVHKSLPGINSIVPNVEVMYRIL